LGGPKPNWDDYRGMVGEIIEINDESTFRARQLTPANNLGREIGKSNIPSNLKIGDYIAIVDGYLRDNSLRGEWYSKVVKVTAD